MKKALAAILATLLVLGAVGATCWLVNIWHESEEQTEKIEMLRQRAVKASVTDMGKAAHEVTEESTPRLDKPKPADATPEPAEHNLSLLQEENPDCIGWLSIPGTPIDFPVMQNKDAPEFYLKHDFDGRYSEYGLPFLDSRCDLEISDNVIIYGHHMNDGSMFSALLKYEDREYFVEHPEIVLETGQGAETYQVAAVIRAAGSYEPEDWSIFNCFDCDEQDVREIAARQLYDTSVELSPGNRLLTLATCEYSQRNGRLAVIAVKT